MFKLDKILIITAAAFISLIVLFDQSQIANAQQYTGVETATLVAANYFGYPIEEYTVQTSDGYLLKLYRIPGNASVPDPTGKKVVMVVHGYLTCSFDWVKLGPQQSLAFTLADAGYDVWLPNFRGNSLSRSHATMNPNVDIQFWDFYMQEVGTIDYPTLIDYVLNATGQTKVHFVSWSGGSMAFMIMGSERSSYMSKIYTSHLLSPGAYFTNAISPPFRAISAAPGGTHDVTQLLGVGEFLPDDTVTNLLFAACKAETGDLASPLCRNILALFSGYPDPQMDLTQVEEIFQYLPAGVSMKAFMHMGQLMRSTRFQKFDNGPLGNLAEYRSLLPPTYRLNRVTAKTAIWYGNHDWLAALVDVDRLSKELPNVISKHMIPIDWTHLDFLYGKDAKALLYDKMVEVMRANEA